MRSRSLSLRKLGGSDGGGNIIQSITSAKTSAPSKNRRILQKNVTSIINQRQNFRIIEDDVDRTPKNLTHAIYHGIDEHHLTAFDTIGLGQGSSNIQLLSRSSGSQYGNLKANSSILIRSNSIHTQQTQITDDFLAGESLTSYTLSSNIDEDRAPSQFYLPRYDSGLIHIRPERVNIILQETDVFFIFELPQLTVDLSSEEGLAVKQNNEQYEYITLGPGSNRKLANAEAQTPCIYRKNRSTCLPRTKRRNQGNLVNNWIMYDTFENLKTSKAKGPIFIDTDEAKQTALEKKGSRIREFWSEKVFNSAYSYFNFFERINPVLSNLVIFFKKNKKMAAISAENDYNLHDFSQYARRLAFFQRTTDSPKSVPYCHTY